MTHIRRILMISKATFMLLLRTVLVPFVILVSFIRLRLYRSRCKKSNFEQNERFFKKPDFKPFRCS